MSPLDDAISRLEAAITRLETALGAANPTAVDPDTAEVAAQIATRVDAALARLSQLLDREA